MAFVANHPEPGRIVAWTAKSGFTMTLRALSVPWIVLLLASITDFRLQSQDCFPAPPGLFAAYSFEGNGRDLVGGHSGIPLGPVQFANWFDESVLPLLPPGWATRSFFPNGGTIRVSDDVALRPSQITVALWVKSPNPGSYRYLLSKSLSPTLASSYALHTGADGLLHFSVCTSLDPLRFILSPPAPVDLWDDEWHAIVGSYDGSFVRLYVDGKEAGTGTAATGPILYGTDWNNGDLFIGAFREPDMSGGAQIAYPGQIDQLELYSRALTFFEMIQVLSTGPFRTCLQSQGMVLRTLPAGGNFALGSKVTLAVDATGTPPLQYQWLRNGQTLDGRTNKTLILDPFQLRDAGSYSVHVNDAIANLVTPPVKVSPKAEALPFADAFAERGLITSATGFGVGTNSLASREPNEPLHASKRGGKSIWVTYRPPGTGTLTLSTVGSTFDTLLAVYTGDRLDQLTRVGANDDGAAGFASELKLPVQGGTNYAIALDGRSGADGIGVLSWELVIENRELPRILRQPVSMTAGLGGDILFDAEVSAGARVQWLKEGQPLIDQGRITGSTTTTLHIQAVEIADVGTYQLRIEVDKQVLSDAVSLQLSRALEGLAPATTFAASDKFADVRDDIGRLLGPSARSRPGAHLAGLVGGTSGTQIFSSTQSSSEEGEPLHCGVRGGASQWFSFQPPINGRYEFNTVGSTFDTLLAIYRDTGLGVGLFDGLVEVGSNNDAEPGLKTSRVLVSLQTNLVYYVAVDGVKGANGTVVLNHAIAGGSARIRVISRDASGLHVQISDASGTSVQVESSTNLHNWKATLGTNITTPLLELVLPTTPNSGYYRTKVQ